ncbi:hypothetical protein MTR_5g048190 [Medicago truncatula]|uniref:Uncharacterized protein n=1 Tax=Medicago truncatula TaxID=3880 RepID=G7JZ96_MEDTR|nr:hypothetical protein MTR_5g048190 [Medicago truncatula]
MPSITKDQESEATTNSNEAEETGWITAGSDGMVRHLPDRVLRQYVYVQTIPRAPTDIDLIAADDVAQTFAEFALHVLSH